MLPLPLIALLFSALLGWALGDFLELAIYAGITFWLGRFWWKAIHAPVTTAAWGLSLFRGAVLIGFLVSAGYTLGLFLDYAFDVDLTQLKLWEHYL